MILNKLYHYGTTTQVLTETGTNPNGVLDSGIIKKGTTNTYSLRLWIKEEAENDSIMNKIFAAKLRIEAEQKTEVLAFIPTYFEFGTPTTSSVTNYTTLGYNVFSGLSSDGTAGGVCINDNGLFCIKANDYDNSVATLKEHFGESSCTDNGSLFSCTSTLNAFNCYANSSGDVHCGDSTANCTANADGSYSCGA